MDILRFITAGNVDDGKSTLIGRLLYDTGNIKSDVLQTVSADDAVNLAYVTDGLRSERAQGITIDVAYKYFTTPRRKYIVTDAPGHFQYTRNLVTGASAADAIIILIDARNGITEQTHRHSLVASFLHIRQIIVAINKMDAVGYAEATYNHIKEQYESAIAAKLNLPSPTFIPISALMGDNVIQPLGNMPWYNGHSLIQCLDACTPATAPAQAFRMAVQYASNAEQIQYCFGKILSGTIQVGDIIAIDPANASGKVAKILAGNVEVPAASVGQNACLQVYSPHKTTRGQLLTTQGNPPQTSNNIHAALCWLDEKPLEVGKEYLLQLNCKSAKCRITHITSKTDVHTFEENNGGTELHINEFAKVTILTTETMAFDAFAHLPATGRGIIIDPDTNYTCGAFTVC